MQFTSIQKTVVSIAGCCVLLVMAFINLNFLFSFLVIAGALSLLIWAYFKNAVPLPGGGCSSGVCSTEVDDQCSSGGCSPRKENDIVIEAEEAITPTTRRERMPLK